MNYGHRTGYNLLPTDADGIISPDILSIVHTAKGYSIYSKQILPQQHILRFQKGSAVSRNEAHTPVSCNSAKSRPSYMVPRAAFRKTKPHNYPMGSKMNSDGLQRTPVCPLRSQDAWVRVNQSHFAHNKKYSDTK